MGRLYRPLLNRVFFLRGGRIKKRGEGIAELDGITAYRLSYAILSRPNELVGFMLRLFET